MQVSPNGCRSLRCFIIILYLHKCVGFCNFVPTALRYVTNEWSFVTCVILPKIPPLSDRPQSDRLLYQVSDTSAQHNAPAVFEIVAIMLAHEVIANAAHIDQHSVGAASFHVVAEARGRMCANRIDLRVAQPRSFAAHGRSAWVRRICCVTAQWGVVFLENIPKRPVGATIDNLVVTRYIRQCNGGGKGALVERIAWVRADAPFGVMQRHLTGGGPHFHRALVPGARHRMLASARTPRQRPCQPAWTQSRAAHRA